MERPRRRAIRLVGLFVLVALAATTGGVLASLGSDGDDSPDDTARAEMTRLVNQRRGATFEVRYLVQLPDVESDRLRMAVWQKGSRFRHDLDLSLPDGNEHLSVIDNGDRRVRCTLREGASWSCADDDSRTLSEVETLLTEVVQSLPGELDVRSTVIGGHDARCFIGAGTGTDEVCLGDRGVVLRAQSSAADIELVEYSKDVNEVIFIPPA